MELNGNNESLVAKAAREFLTEIDKIEVDPRKLVHAVVERVASMGFPPENQEKAARLIRELRNSAQQQEVVYSLRSFAAVTTSVRNVEMEALCDRLGFFKAEARKLMKAPVQKSQRDLWAPRANDCGWPNRQYDLLIQHLDVVGGERITAITGNHQQAHVDAARTPAYVQTGERTNAR